MRNVHIRAVAALVAAAVMLAVFGPASLSRAQQGTSAQEQTHDLAQGHAEAMEHPEATAQAAGHAESMHHAGGEDDMTGHGDHAEHADMAAEHGDHAEHGDMAAEEEHVHPTQTPAEVGVNEKLGDVLPDGLTFTDSRGDVVELRSLIDRPTIIAPIYFNCPTVCNLLQSSLARVLPEVALSPGEEYQVVSLSFDELDTPEIAARKKKQYVTAMQGRFPPEAWHFLTGDLENIRGFTDAVGFGFQRMGRDFAHPVILVAVSPGGRIVRYLYGNAFMPFDIAMAATEAAEGKVGLSVKRVLSFCFSYDPEGREYTFNIMRVAGAAVLVGIGIFVLALILGGKKRKRNRN